jgi:hypothetical protein
MSKKEMRHEISDLTGCAWRNSVSLYIHSISTFEDYKKWALTCVTFLRQELRRELGDPEGY